MERLIYMFICCVYQALCDNHVMFRRPCAYHVCNHVVLCFFTLVSTLVLGMIHSVHSMSTLVAKICEIDPTNQVGGVDFRIPYHWC